MKRIIRLSFVLGVMTAQTLIAQPLSMASSGTPDEVGPDYKLWNHTVPRMTSSSRVNSPGAAATPPAARVMEIASGMNYWNGKQWSPADPSFTATADGFAAGKVQDPLLLQNNLYCVGAVTVATRNGSTLSSTPVGISLYDPASGNVQVIAVVTNSIGVMISSNQVLYPDAFVGGACADVVYTLEKGSFHQDVVFKGHLDPTDFGFPTNSRIQILTEFYQAPTPTILTRPLYVEQNQTIRKQKASPDLVDHVLSFNEFVLGTGMAYAYPDTTHTNGAEAVVAKEFKKVSGRTFLIESIDSQGIRQALKSLPECGMGRGLGTSYLRSPAPAGYACIPTPKLLAATQPKVHSRAKLQMAYLDKSEGVVVDYVAQISGSGPTLLQKDTTYHVTGPVYYYGPVNIEGGTVVKYDSGTFISLGGSVTCKTSSYLPAIFTATDDNSVGESIGSGTINPNGYANPALLFPYVGSATLSNVRFAFAQEAIKIVAGFVNASISHAQFIQCLQGIELANTTGSGSGSGSGGSGGGWFTVTVENVLFSFVNTPLLCSVNGSGSGGSLGHASFYNCTIDHAQTFFSSYNGAFSLTAYNSIFANTTTLASHLNTLSGSHNGCFNSPAFGVGSYTTATSPFQNAGQGNYYLNDGSSFHGLGTTSIDPALLADLKTRTTHSPVAFPALMQVSGNLTLFPQVPRYTSGPPDLGYYYPAMDYTVATMILAGGSVTVEPGTAIAVRNDYVPAQGGWTQLGFVVEQSSSFVSHGTPAAPITFTSTKMVQEQPETDFTQFQKDYGLTYSAVSFVPAFYPDDLNSPAPTLDFRFSNFYLPEQDYHIWSGWNVEENDYWSDDSSVYLSLQDCNLYGGRVNLGLPYYTPGTDEFKDYVWAPGAISWFNNLFDRVNINLNPTFYSYNNVINCDMQVQAYNNLFRGGGFHLKPFPATAGNWLFEDNLFDKVHLYQDTVEPLDYDYNAYWPLQISELTGDGDTTEFSATDTSNDGFTDGGHEHTLTAAPPYQSGPLGDYCLPTTTPLYNAGSRSAADAGLAQYSTQVNQAKDSGQVDIGLHYIATSSSTSATPKDTDSDGVPDYVEDANGNGTFDVGTETDWQHDNSTTDPNTGLPVADAYSSVYDDIDLSGNGLVGRIKKALGKSPLDSSNPLTLTQVITGEEPDIATFEVPLQFSLVDYGSTDAVGKLNLLMDGNPLSAYYGANGNGLCRFEWDTRFNPPGYHNLQVEFRLNYPLAAGLEPDATVVYARGQLVSHTSQNELQFDPFYSEYNAANGAMIYARLTDPAASFTVELQTTSGTHVKWLAVNQTSSTGEIELPWDLTDDNGQAYTGNSVKAAFTLNPSGNTSWIELYSSLFSPDDGDFTIAYACNSGGDNQDLRDCIQWTVVDQLIGFCNATFCFDHFYESTFNSWSDLGQIAGNPGHLSNQADADALLNNLANVNFGPGNPFPIGHPTKNFYFFGHNIGTRFGTLNDDVNLNQNDIAKALGNLNFTYGRNKGIRCDGQQYRFVFLDACSTADDSTWANAFGIRKTITEKNLTFRPDSVQAFVGWQNEKRNPLFNYFNMSDCESLFWSAWQNGIPLDRCIYFASKNHPPAPFNFLDLSEYNLGDFQHWNNWTQTLGLPHWYYKWKDPKITIYGYAGITRTGFAPGYDNSFYYKK